MKKLVCIFVLYMTFKYVSAQEIKGDIAYQYIYSKQWDKAIQTYNFSRPFLTEKQPLLIHGINPSLSYIFKSSNNLKHGINLSYSYFRSSAKNENFKNILNLHFLQLGYILHYENSEKLKNAYVDLIVSAISNGLFRNLNGESFEYDEKKSKAYGIGGNLTLKFGYYFEIKEKIISPYLSVGYTPYLYSPNTEAVINQTKGLTSKTWTGIFNLQMGVSYHIQRKN